MSPQRFRFGAAATLLLAVSVSGFHRQQPRPKPQRPEWVPRFIAAANRMSFATARVPERDTGVPRTAYPSSDVPQMSIAKPQTRAPGQVEALVARIWSAK